MSKFNPRFQKVYAYTNSTLLQFADALCPYLTVLGCGGGGGNVDVKVKVTANDTTTDYLSAKLQSTDGSVDFTILNPGGDEIYDVSVGVLVRTVAQANAEILAATLKPGRLYLITDAFDGTCRIFIWAVTNSQFNQSGWGVFSNDNTSIALDKTAFMKYDVVTDKVYEVWIPNDNLRLVAAEDTANSPIRKIPLEGYYRNVHIEDGEWTGTRLSTATSLNFRIENCYISNMSMTINSSLSLGNCRLEWSNLNALGTGTVNLLNTTIKTSSTVTCNTFIAFSININECEISDSEVEFVQKSNDIILDGLVAHTKADITLEEAYCEHCFVRNAKVTLEAGSIASACQVLDGGELELKNGHYFKNCKVGMGKKVKPALGYVGNPFLIPPRTENGFLENLDSTYEVNLNPDVNGVLDMDGYQFVGIVRIGTTGVPASWDLKQVINFPTDHIFCIVPADSNTVDVYDAGVGGTDIYLSTAAVVIYDGSKDDTLVLRSGLNDYTRLFQIGGWQAPSA